MLYIRSPLEVRAAHYFRRRNLPPVTLFLACGTTRAHIRLTLRHLRKARKAAMN